MVDREKAMLEIKKESAMLYLLNNALCERITEFCDKKGLAGYEYDRNHNSSKSALLDIIKTVRNELLVLSKQIKEI